MRTVLLDADTFVYAAALHVEIPTQWDEDLWTLHASLDAGIARLDELVDEVREGLSADRVILALTDYENPNWRLKVMAEYKLHRKKTRRPVIWRPLREYIEEKYETFRRPTLEGDDILGILLTSPAIVPGEKICVSIDKDMRTLPGLHVNWQHARDAVRRDKVPYDSQVFALDEDQADRFHLLQTLAGDAVDGYPGCPGVGMVGAEKLLDDCLILEPYEHTFTRGARKGEIEIRWEGTRLGTPWEIVVSAYRRAGLSEEVALRNARVARICRVTDFDFDTKEVRQWSP